MKPSNNSNSSSGGGGGGVTSDDNDDEFDDLFSFGVGTNNNSTTKANSHIAQEEGATSSSGNSSPSLSESYHKVPAPSQTTTSSSSSTTAKSISSTTNNAITNDDDDDDDDIFGDFDLNLDTKSNMASSKTITKEEDFNGMDEGTREFLDFLDQDQSGGDGGGRGGAVSGGGGSGGSGGVADNANGGMNRSMNNIDMDDILGPDSPSKKVMTQPSTTDDILAGLDDSDSEEDGKGVHNKNNMHKDEDEDNVLVEEPIGDSNNNDYGNDDMDEMMIAMEDNNDLEDITGFVTIHSNSNEDPATTTTTATTKTTTTTTSKEKKIYNDDTTNKDISTHNIYTTTTMNTIKEIKPTRGQLQQPPPKQPARQTSLPTLPKSSLSKKNRQSSTSSVQSDSILASISDMEKQHKYDSVLQDDDDDGGNTDENGIGTNQSFSIDEDDEKNDMDEQEEEKILTFESLMDALQSPESTIEHIRPFIYTNKRQTQIAHTQTATTAMSATQSSSNYITSITKDDRPFLWSKVICAKVLSDVQTSSLVDTFIDWNDNEFDYAKFLSKENVYDLDTEFVDRLVKEVNVLSLRIMSGLNDNCSDGDDMQMESNFQLEDADHEDGMSAEDKQKLVKAKRELSSLLVFYYRSTSNLSTKKIKSFASILKKIDTSPNDDDNGNGNNDAGYTEKKVEENNKEEDGDNKKVDESGNVGKTENETKKETEEQITPAANKEMDENSAAAVIESTVISKEAPKIESKPLLGPIAATLLSAGVPVEVASVMLSKIISTLPLFSLTKLEQQAAVKSLHQQLYFLVCYHLPLLVLHLDRYAPGWHWPRVDFDDDDESKNDSLSVTERGRNLQAQGTIPVTWFASLLAGEGTSKTLAQPKLLPLWDILLTSDDQSLKFFLALATLEKHSDSLMMLRGQELIDELSSVMSLKSLVEIGDESFLGNHNSIDRSKEEEFVLNWYHDARQLQEATPISVTLDLRKAEDVAVNHILTMRSKTAMEQMTARLEAEAEAHKKAVQEENARKAEARMNAYYKKRLERFYERHCPEKKSTVDSILDTYKDRYILLDHKLQKKYGSGFLPLMAVFNPKISNQTNKFVSSLGQGIETRKKNIVAKRAKERAEKLDEDMMGPGAHQVAAKVSASEILPFVCGGSKNSASRGPIKYYLVDSRPNETIQVQGSFPTSVRLSPEDLMDPDKIQEKVDMFESLRGAIHICIMGEGFSSFPTLYDHPLNKVEEKLLDDDKARTNMCALFFIKKGFPFISVLDGGFAAAHAWIARDCEYLTLNKVLVDYDDKTSLFAELERFYQAQKEFSNASTRRKTTLALQKLIDNSMTRLTMLENRIEEFTDRPRGRDDSAQNKASDANETSNMSVSKKNEDNQASSINNANSAGDDGRDEEGSLPKTQKDSNDEIRNNVNKMKSGFNKAFSGLKNIRVPQAAKDRNSDEASGIAAAKSGTKMNAEAADNDNKQPERRQNQGFKFGRLNFGNKKNNVFNRKMKQSNSNDNDLEKEIEASLTKPDGDKVMVGVQTKDKPIEKKPTTNRQFVNPLNKFGSINRKNKTATATAIIREEESLFFDDEESLDDTEDSLSFQIMT